MLEFFLLVALVLFFALIWWKFRGSIFGALDGRAVKIRQELDEAQKLHEEAKSMLAKYQRQLHEGEQRAVDIRAHAEAERERLEVTMRRDFEEMVERRTQQANDRIAREEAKAVQEIRARSAHLAVQTTRLLITDKMTGDHAQEAANQAIDEIRQKLA